MSQMSRPPVWLSPRIFLPRHSVLPVNVGALGQFVPGYFGPVEELCCIFSCRTLYPLRKTGGTGRIGLRLLTSLFRPLTCVSPCLPGISPCSPCLPGISPCSPCLPGAFLGGEGVSVQMQHGPQLP